MTRLYFDGSVKDTPSWGFLLELSIPIEGRGTGGNTSMESEYHALIHGLEKAVKMGVSELEVLGDSQVVINQVLGLSTARGVEKELRDAARILMALIPTLSIKHIPRKENKADEILS